MSISNSPSLEPVILSKKEMQAEAEKNGIPIPHTTSGPDLESLPAQLAQLGIYVRLPEPAKKPAGPPAKQVLALAQEHNLHVPYDLKGKPDLDTAIGQLAQIGIDLRPTVKVPASHLTSSTHETVGQSSDLVTA